MLGSNYKVDMRDLVKRLGRERIIAVHGAISLLLIFITVIVCHFCNFIPEEGGITSAAICASIILFFTMVSVLGKEGIEGLFYALVGSFMAWLVLTLLGSRLAFDPSINNYFLASAVLSIVLSISGILYAMPENLNLKGEKSIMKRILIWLLSTTFSVIVNFIIIYWVPRMI